MDTCEFERIMEVIVNAIAERGYDPYSQLRGYLQENNPQYITQHNNARELILSLDKKKVYAYLKDM